MLRACASLALACLCLGSVRPAAAAPTVVTLFSAAVVTPAWSSSAPVPTRGAQSVTVFASVPTELAAVFCYFTVDSAADPTTVPNVLVLAGRAEPGVGFQYVDSIAPDRHLAPAPPLRVTGPFFQCRAYCFGSTSCAPRLTVKALLD